MVNILYAANFLLCAFSNAASAWTGCCVSGDLQKSSGEGCRVNPSVDLKPLAFRTSVRSWIAECSARRHAKKKLIIQSRETMQPLRQRREEFAASVCAHRLPQNKITPVFITWRFWRSLSDSDLLFYSWLEQYYDKMAWEVGKKKSMVYAERFPLKNSEPPYMNRLTCAQPTAGLCAARLPLQSSLKWACHAAGTQHGLLLPNAANADVRELRALRDIERGSAQLFFLQLNWYTL